MADGDCARDAMIILGVANAVDGCNAQSALERETEASARRMRKEVQLSSLRRRRTTTTTVRKSERCPTTVLTQ